MCEIYLFEFFYTINRFCTTIGIITCCCEKVFDGKPKSLAAGVSGICGVLGTGGVNVSACGKRLVVPAGGGA